MAPHWSGVFPAFTTQMREDQSLDLAQTATHLEALIDSGVHGLVACGSLGENQTLLPDEKLAVVKAAGDTAAGRIPVVAGVAETNTRAAREYISRCEELGVAGFMVMPPMVYKPDTRETTHYFRTIAASTKLPWMLYNNPVGYNTDVTPAMFGELTDIKNLVAIKESSADPRRVTEIRNVVGDRYAVFTGVDDLMLESAILGIDGWVCGSGIGFPAENQALWNLTLEGRWDEARTIYRWSQPMMKLDTHVHFVQYIKLLVAEAGLGNEWVREPRLPLPPEEREPVVAMIQECFSKRPTLG